MTIGYGGLELEFVTSVGEIPPRYPKFDRTPRCSRPQLWRVLGSSRSDCCADRRRLDAGCYSHWSGLPEVGECKRTG